MTPGTMTLEDWKGHLSNWTWDDHKQKFVHPDKKDLHLYIGFLGFAKEDPRDDRGVHIIVTNLRASLWRKMDDWRQVGYRILSSMESLEEFENWLKERIGDKED